MPTWQTRPAFSSTARANSAAWASARLARLLARRVRRVERADLDADAARLEPRQPVPLEESLLAAPQNELERLLLVAAEDELEQEVVVRVDDHGRQSAPRLTS